MSRGPFPQESLEGNQSEVKIFLLMCNGREKASLILKRRGPEGSKIITIRAKLKANKGLQGRTFSAEKKSRE